MKEFRVYVVDLDMLENSDDFVTKEMFMEIAENTGRVYTLEGFQSAFNYEEVNTHTDIIKIIEVEV